MKTKNIIILIGLLLFFTGSVFVLHKVSFTLQKKKEQYVSIPIFHLSDLNGEIVSDTTIDRNKTVLFYFFDPECNLCRSTIDSLKTKYREFSGHQILLVTLASEKEVKEFLDTIDFRPPENMKILFDENTELFSLVGIISPPASLIYKKGILIKRFDGPVKTETLLKYLE